MTEKARVLIIDRNPTTTGSLARILRRIGYETMVANQAAAGRGLFLSFRPELVLLDWELPDCHGISVLRWMQSRSSCPIVMFATREDARIAGLEYDEPGGNLIFPDAFCPKPFGFRDVLSVIRNLEIRSAFRWQASAPEERPGSPAINRFVDPRRLHHIVTKLMMEAICTGQEGGPLHVAVSECGEDVAVEISHEDQVSGESILDHRPDLAGPRAPSGTSLRLEVARRLVEAHGGGILLETRPGNPCVVRIAV